MLWLVVPVVQVLLAGNTKTNTDALNKCDINDIAGPDNLYYTNGNLLIAEDSSLHYNNVLWTYNVKTGKDSSLVRVLRCNDLQHMCINRVTAACSMSTVVFWHICRFPVPYSVFPHWC